MSGGRQKQAYKRQKPQVGKFLDPHLPNMHHKPWKEETRSIYVEEDILEDQNVSTFLGSKRKFVNFIGTKILS